MTRARERVRAPEALPDGETHGVRAAGAPLDPGVVVAVSRYAQLLAEAGHPREAVELSGSLERARSGASTTDAAVLEGKFATSEEGGMREWLLQAGACEAEVARVWRKARARQWQSHAAAFERACKAAKELAEVAAANDDLEEIQRLLQLLQAIQGGSYSALIEFMDETDVTDLTDL